MFESEAQKNEAICALLSTIIDDVGAWWTETGPTEQTWRLLGGRSYALSSGQELLIQVGVDLWNGHGSADFGRMLGILSPEPLAALGWLLVAMTQRPEAIDAWIARTSRRTA